MAGDTGNPSAHADAIIASARSGEPDRYLAALLAPHAARNGLLALAAFSAEIARVPYAASSEPAVGEIRLQWWRDALETQRGSASTGSPIADALRSAVDRHALPPALLLDMIEARSFDLSEEFIADDTAFRAYLWKTQGAPFALAARVLSQDPQADAAAAAGGYAYGLARLFLELPRMLSRGRLPLPQSRLTAAGLAREVLLAGEASDGSARLLADLRKDARSSLVSSRQHVAKLPRQLRTAFLPLALVESYLRVLERPGRDPLRDQAEIVPLTRVYRILAAHWLGGI